MRTGREIRSYDYVNHPYERVRDALKQNSVTVFQSATKAAAFRAQSATSELHVDFAGMSVKTDIHISVRRVEEKVVDLASTPLLRLELESEAATRPHLFPFMKAELTVYPLTATETFEQRFRSSMLASLRFRMWLVQRIGGLWGCCCVIVFCNCFRN